MKQTKRQRRLSKEKQENRIKRKEELLEKQRKDEVAKDDLWQKVGAYCADGEIAIEEKDFNEIIDDFAKVYKIIDLMHFAGEHADFPQLTSDFLSKWAGITEKGKRESEIQAWIDEELLYKRIREKSNVNMPVDLFRKCEKEILKAVNAQQSKDQAELVMALGEIFSIKISESEAKLALQNDLTHSLLNIPIVAPPIYSPIASIINSRFRIESFGWKTAADYYRLSIGEDPVSIGKEFVNNVCLNKNC